jgi:trk system potassium uptake protein
MAEHYAVLGLSTFGYTLALELQSNGAEVLVIDRDPDLVQQVGQIVTKAVCADIRRSETLDEFDVAAMAAVILAMPKHFDVAVLTTRYLAKRKAPRIVVQVVSDVEADALRAVGATKVVFPEEDIAYRTAAELVVPGCSDLVHAAQGTAVMEIPCPPEWVGRSLEKIQVRRKHRINIIAVFPPETAARQRAPDPVPAPDEELKGDHRLLVFGRIPDLAALRKLLPTNGTD